MNMRPCTSCRRHVSAEVSRCPFCDAELPSLLARVLHVGGRLSRAAVFAAGAAACYTGSTATTDNTTPPPPPPPPDDTQQRDTGSGSTFAQPPPPADTETGRVRGVVRQGGAVLAGIRVRATATAAPHSQLTTTNNRGEYVLDVVPGRYRVIAEVFTGGRMPPPQLQVEIGAGEEKTVDIDVPMPAPRDTGPCCKPYGAPPARRRVV